jgi:hypothetical protein
VATLAAGLLLWLVAGTADAVEVYGLFRKDCQATVGAIVRVGDETADVLTLAGTTEQVPLADVTFVARYDVLENPFPRIGPREVKRNGKGKKADGRPGPPPLLNVTSESSEGEFRAYATNFYEDLVLFLDQSGKIRVVQWDEIVAITLAGPAAASARGPAWRPVSLVPPPGRGHCPSVSSPSSPPAVAGADAAVAAPSGSVVERPATQVVTDRLRLDSFWAEMRAGHQDLDSLRERTLFYARPLLVDKKTRFGITAARGNRADVYQLTPPPWDAMPLYLEFGGGSAYRFQSSTSLGTKSWRMIPQVRPIGAVRSEFKSHLLHGIFLANLNGFTAGNALYQESWSSDPDEHRHEPWMDSSFNHLTLLGADYGAWSISYGYYFPDYVVGAEGEFREVTSTTAAPVGRVGYLASAWQLELFAFNTDMDADGGAPEDAYLADQRFAGDQSLRYWSTRYVPETAHVASSAARIALTAWFPNDLMAWGDVSFAKTSYHETAYRLDEPLEAADRPPVFFPDSDTGEGGETDGGSTPGGSSRPRGTAPAGRYVSAKITQTWIGARLGVRMDLGQWVALNAEGSYEYSTTKGGFLDSGEGTASTDRAYTYLASMELLL